MGQSVSGGDRVDRVGQRLNGGGTRMYAEWGEEARVVGSKRKQRRARRRQGEVIDPSGRLPAARELRRSRAALASPRLFRVCS